MNALGISNIVQGTPILYASMERETAVVKKQSYKLLVSYDKVKYYIDYDGRIICDNMLEIEDWTTPNTMANDDDMYDAHLYEVNSILLNAKELALQPIKYSKPFRGLMLFNQLDYENYYT